MPASFIDWLETVWKNKVHTQKKGYQNSAPRGTICLSVIWCPCGYCFVCFQWIDPIVPQGYCFSIRFSLSASKSSKFFYPSDKVYTVTTKELQPVGSLWTTTITGHSICTYFHVQVSWPLNARQVIMLHVYFYGNLICLWLRKKWTICTVYVIST